MNTRPPMLAAFCLLSKTLTFKISRMAKAPTATSVAPANMARPRLGITPHAIQEPMSSTVQLTARARFCSKLRPLESSPCQQLGAYLAEADELLGNEDETMSIRSCHRQALGLHIHDASHLSAEDLDGREIHDDAAKHIRAHGQLV